LIARLSPADFSYNFCLRVFLPSHWPIWCSLATHSKTALAIAIESENSAAVSFLTGRGSKVEGCGADSDFLAELPSELRSSLALGQTRERTRRKSVVEGLLSLEALAAGDSSEEDSGAEEEESVAFLG